MAGAAAISLEERSQGKTTRVQCITSPSLKPFIIEVYHSWSPLGVKRFLELVNDDFFTDVALYRCVKGFLCQFGISPDPNSPKKKYWQSQGPIKDDPTLGIPFQRGTLSFAGGGPNTRTTQLFITFADLSFLGKSPWETPLGVVTVGMEMLIDTLYTGYGDQVPFNAGGVDQHTLQNRGNEYLRNEFPHLSYFKECTVVGESHQAEAAITMETTENDHQSQYEESNGEALRELLRPPLDISSFHKPRPIPQSAHVEPREYEESNGEALRELLRPPLDFSSFDKPRSIPQSAHVEPRDVKRVSFFWTYLFVGIVLAFGLWTWNSKKSIRARRMRRKHLLEP